jgi:hypothetical protein
MAARVEFVRDCQSRMPSVQAQHIRSMICGKA